MSNEKNTGGAAFPNDREFARVPGMTLRDYFAAKALQALITKSVFMPQHTDPVTNEPLGYRTEYLTSVREALTTSAYAYADAMIKAREQ